MVAVRTGRGKLVSARNCFCAHENIGWSCRKTVATVHNCCSCWLAVAPPAPRSTRLTSKIWRSMDRIDTSIFGTGHKEQNCSSILLTACSCLVPARACEALLAFWFHVKFTLTRTTLTRPLTPSTDVSHSYRRDYCRAPTSHPIISLPNHTQCDADLSLTLYLGSIHGQVAGLSDQEAAVQVGSLALPTSQSKRVASSYKLVPSYWQSAVGCDRVLLSKGVSGAKRCPGAKGCVGRWSRCLRERGRARCRATLIASRW